MRLLVLIAAAVALLTCLSTAALAQFDATDKSQFGVGAISFMPTAPHLKQISKTWLGPVIDWHLRYDKADRPGAMISLGWFNQEKDGLRANFTPITASVIQRFPKNSDTCWYAGGGVNFAFLSYDEFGIKDKTTGKGISLQFGREWSTWYVGMRYDNFGSLHTKYLGDVDFNGLSFTVGSRFTF